MDVSRFGKGRVWRVWRTGCSSISGLLMQDLLPPAPMESADPHLIRFTGLCSEGLSGFADRGLTCLPSPLVVPCATFNEPVSVLTGRTIPSGHNQLRAGASGESPYSACHFHVASPARAGTAMAMASICRFSHPEPGVGFSGSPSAAAAGRSDSAASRSSRARKRASRPSPTASSPVPAATHWPAGAAPRACPRSPTLPSACGMTSGPAGAIRGTPTTGRRAWRAMVPRIGRMAVCDVASADVLAILTPIWHIDDAVERQRGWRKNPGSQQPRRFHWPAWRQPLDSAGIDALLDAWNPEPEARATWPRVGVHAAWRSVRFEPRGSTDKTRAFGAERL